MDSRFFDFIKTCSLSSSGNISKKDVLRFLDFCCLAYGKRFYRKGNDYFVDLQIPQDIKDFMKKDLNVFHYFRIENFYDDIQTLLLPKRLRNVFVKDDKFIIKSHTVKFMKEILNDILLDIMTSPSYKLKNIDKFLKQLNFSNTSIKVFKQTSFLLNPLHRCFVKSVSFDECFVYITFSRWITTKPYLISKMIKRKAGYKYKSITWEFDLDTLKLSKTNLNDIFSTKELKNAKIKGFDSI